jgi:hypothetical protein
MGNIANELFSTGNHARVFLTGNGVKELIGVGLIGGPLGKGTNVSIGESSGVQPVYVLGDVEPQDLVDTRHAYNVRLDTLRLRDEEAKRSLRAERVRIEVVDRFNRRVMAVAEECQVDSSTLNFPANGLVAHNLTFQCLRTTG